MDTSRRITPAGAGKTLLNAIQYALGEDHPRRCGENFYASVVLAFASGSPPQVRGKRKDMIHLDSHQRITPAGAGKTCLCREGCWRVVDHPRRCGENPTWRKELLLCLGSPPQVRGKPAGAFRSRTPTRITPAGAGKTDRFLYCEQMI